MVTNTITLAGPPCSGKSTVGKVLSELLCAEFRDTDYLVEAQREHPIQWIFEHEGEHIFRVLEHRVLKEILSRPIEFQVVALGGGTLLDRNNLAMVNEKTILFTLTASSETLLKRNTGNRPLAADSNTFLDLLKQREQHYQSLGNIISTEHKTPDEVAEEIRRAVLPLLSR